MTERDLESYLRSLVTLPRMQSLWQIKDRGMPVFAHAVDVSLLCLDAFPKWCWRYGQLDLVAVVVGSLVHDVSKLTAHHSNGHSHSYLMSSQPGVVVGEVTELLQQVEDLSGVKLGREQLENVKHIVASHHGPWGRVLPRTPEADLVYHSDLYSATHHRLAPVDANDILPLLSAGCRWAQVSVRLGVGRAVVKARLQEACRAEQVGEWVELLPIWQQRGFVLIGSDERLRQLGRARLVIELARQVPESLLDKIGQAAAGYGRGSRGEVFGVGTV